MDHIEDANLVNCTHYEDYLDSLILDDDIRYIRNMEICRQLVKNGYRTKTKLYTPTQFLIQKQAALEALVPIKRADTHFSKNLTFDDPVLKELADRELQNRRKMISTIIFIQHRHSTGFEVSSYIDYANSLQAASMRMPGAINWRSVFEGRIKLKPSQDHLSYYDWRSGVALFNESDNYKIIHDIRFGLTFMHKGDHKKICVDPCNTACTANCICSYLYSNKYGNVTLYDHIIRKKV